MFFAILEKIQPRIEKQDTKWRKAIEPAVRLAIALRYFATGDSYISLSYSWYISHSTISLIVKEVGEAIIAEYSEELLCPPVTPEGWKNIARRFHVRWNFPHVLGALDGKHVAIQKPQNSGSLYHNYKGFFSIVMLALVDGDYRFLWVDAGTNGACSDAQIWNDCELKEMIEDQQLGLPDPEPVVEGERALPYFIVGDDAFALTTYLQKPFSKRRLTKEERIFNYRLSRARRIVENAFGILVNRFRCMLTTLRLKPKTCEVVVLACCCLHNILRNNSPGYLKGLVDEEDEDHNLIPAPWRDTDELIGGERIRARNTGSTEAKDVREYLKVHFNSPEGAVEWQDRMITLNPQPKAQQQAQQQT